MPERTNGYVLGFEAIDRGDLAKAGGKGAHLAELSRIADVRVPPGFCVTTAAFERVVAEAPPLAGLLHRLSLLAPDDREAIRALSAEVRRTIEEVAMPDDIASAVTHAIAAIDERAAYAVRSSATAEDLPTASFAGQQDTYLNVVGSTQILRHVSRCWASLFTERAVTYRLRNRIDHRKVRMAVVVQRMVFPRAAGVLFTADPITGHRKTASVEATFGLGEALVSGQVNADVYKVRAGEVVSKTIGKKQIAVHASSGGGTRTHTLAREQQEAEALSDAEAVQLVELGRRIEAHFGAPQDIEWCLVDDAFHIVQSRPITTLFPIPAVADGENHVYLSVGHQQMMTDVMKPLGLSFYKMTTRAPMHEAGGRLFVDATRGLASPASRAALLMLVGKGEPLMRDALETVLARGDFIRSVPDAGGPPPPAAPPIETDPAIVRELIASNAASVEASKQAIRGKSGPALFEFIRSDMAEMQRFLFDPSSHRVIMAALDAAHWLNEQLEAWLGEKNGADILTQSVPHNVTSEMGLALLDVADAIRPHAEVVAFLRQVDDDDFLPKLTALPGGGEARGAIAAFLERYGMRCVAEIDITRPRWSERPSALLPVLLGNVASFEPGASARRFEQGRRAASKKEAEVLERLRSAPGGAEKASETKRMIDRLRAFIGYREYPKYGMISRYFVYKQALLTEAERLVESRVLRERDDVFFLTFDEFEDVVRTRRVDEELVRRRKDEHTSYGALTPPRVLTSDGEMISGTLRRDGVPPGALVGLPVSTGTVEGRARVILDIADADLEAGDILVTAYTDPSWTPLFLAVKGLVTEVGGVMTHGAVVAREYGLPAVVGVENATTRIPDRQRIRVDGTNGLVEILP